MPHSSTESHMSSHACFLVAVGPTFPPSIFHPHHPLGLFFSNNKNLKHPRRPAHLHLVWLLGKFFKSLNMCQVQFVTTKILKHAFEKGTCKCPAPNTLHNAVLIYVLRKSKNNMKLDLKLLISDCWCSWGEEALYDR